MNYPEHEKLSGIKEQSQALGSILDWMFNEKGWYLVEWKEDDDGYKQRYAITSNVNQILAEYYKVDLVKLEEEKMQMLDEIRKLNKIRE